MTVKIFIKRHVSTENVLALTLLLKKLRSLTLNQPGYIFGETLKRVDRDDECMVISTWRSLEDWNAWLNNQERATIQSEIDLLLGQETTYSAYEV
ncbi:antibiotic biosynthesis monooxygenase [Desulforhopalus sp. IMCC35007]|uniref:antibiotic biosynthesis monooxygenase family protein n=1 Tax=Desulforhopalus sp. IMCC35007 TaxID=2569543 RepID=UPI0010AE722D|nr:antibiotic biosynthesis monooxygenase [Desulforhopalus sp. IMCC35007]TKB11710.1 antibiotic biosynthesis monooxygenase [Desulforhopalus sp. IMCC35007]